jgi:gliding motility-associated-like protein
MRLRNAVFCVACLLMYCVAASQETSSLRFTENNGQWNQAILYQADLSSGRIYLEPSGFTFQIWDGDALHEAKHGHNTHPLNVHAHTLKFKDGNVKEPVNGFYADKTYKNYILGKDKNKWKSNVRSYQKVVYSNVWQNIDVAVYGTGDAFKYDVTVHAGASSDSVKLLYEGIQNPHITNGEFRYKTSLGEFREMKPYCYQEIKGERKTVSCNYNFDASNNTLSFKFPAGYNTQYDLIIDPTLIFSSYTGSSADNFGFTATYDSIGDLYAGGIVFGVGYPTTVGAYQIPFGGGQIDMSISKFSSNGASLLYSTYIGGTDNEQPSSLVVNSKGELVILGTTSSPDFPVTPNAFDNSFAGGPFINYPQNGLTYNNGSDIVVTVLNASGTGLTGSTFIGGTGNDGLNDAVNLHYNYGDQFRGEIILNHQDEIYVASSTRSNDFPLAGTSFQSTLNGTHDACIFKLNNDCSQLLSSTYLGGSTADAAYGIKLDSIGQIYVTGGTSSIDFPTTAGVIHTTYQGGVTDGFIAKFTANGSSLLNATYLGTAAYDQSFFVEIDGDGDVYVTGQSLGSYPVTAGVYNNPGGKQFIHKLNNSFNSTLYSTVFGSGSTTTNISPTAFLVDICENVYVSGWGGDVNQFAPNPFTQGYTTGMALSSDALQTSSDGSDFYYIVLNKNAQSLLYATYFGGNGVNEHVDGGTSRFDRNGIVYQAMCAGCGGSDFTPTTPGVWSNTNNSFNCNLLGMKLAFDLSGTYVDIDAFPRATGCVPLNVQFNSTVSNAQNIIWYFGDGGFSFQQNPLHVYTDTGIYTVMLIGIDSNSCNIADTAYLDVWVRDDSLVANFLPNLQVNCDSNKVSLNTSAYNTTSYNWNMGDGTVYSSDSLVHYYQNPGTYSITLIITDTTKCNLADTFSTQVFIPESVDATFTISSAGGCVPLPVSFAVADNGSSVFLWNFGDGGGAIIPVITHTYQNAGVFTVSLIVTDSSSCNVSDTATSIITVIDSAADASINFLRTFFGCDSVMVTVWSNYVGEDAELWDFGDGTTSTNDSASHIYSVAGTYTITHTITDLQQICKPVDTAQIVISLLPLNISVSIPDTGGCLPFIANFTGNSALVTTDFYWFFGDGDSTDGDFVSHTYTNTGTFNVTILATDTNACVGADSSTAVITVINDSVTAAFQLIVLNDCDSNLVIDLINQSINSVSYSWDFGDGSISINTNENHIYTIPETYTVTLIAQDTNRCHPIDSISQTVTLLPNVFVDFSAEDVCLGDAVQFINTSNPSAQFVWSFGDNNFSNQFSPSHIYSNAGTYNVTLSITDNSTCNVNDTAIGQVTVNLQPIAGFNIAKDTFLFETPVSFSNNSIFYSQVNWSFGDGSNSTEENPTHIYNTIGWKQVCIIASNTACADTFCKDIFILYVANIGVPNAFSPNGDGVNDVVKIEGKGIIELTFRIFNRWGEMVFETRDKNIGWDGIYKGVLQEIETYTYTADAVLVNGDKKLLRGNITLLR